jgi:small subunit ribosomal protein S17
MKTNAQTVEKAVVTSQPKQFTGKVVSVKMKDTVVVEINNYVKLPKYEKFVQRTKRYKAHDAGNTKKLGETVTIEETRPLSRDKHFRVI